LTPFDLVNAQDVEGGKEYTYPIKHKLSIEANSRNLDIVLCEGGSCTEWVMPSNDRLDCHVCQAAEGLPLGPAGLVRHLVRLSASVEAELAAFAERSDIQLTASERSQLRRLESQQDFIDRELRRMRQGHDTALANYVRSFQMLYSDGELQLLHSARACPLFESFFPISSIHTQSDACRRCRSHKASHGRAQLEIVPEDPSFYVDEMSLSTIAPCANWQSCLAMDRAGHRWKRGCHIATVIRGNLCSRTQNDSCKQQWHG